MCERRKVKSGNMCLYMCEREENRQRGKVCECEKETGL